jgi:penicillin amidase
MMDLQTDELSIPARTLTPLLARLNVQDSAAEIARSRLLAWDFVLAKESVEAGIYAAFEGRLRQKLTALMIPQSLRPFIRSVPARKLLERMVSPDGSFGTDPLAGRDALLAAALTEAVEELTQRFGPDPEAWVYGQEGYKHILLRHPLSNAVNAEWKNRLEVGPIPRGGYGLTLNQTGMGDNQTSGASFRIVVDTGDWDRTMGMNNPGQGGHPDHPHYSDLFELWAQDGFHPVFFTRPKVESVTGEWLLLRPSG